MFPLRLLIVLIFFLVLTAVSPHVSLHRSGRHSGSSLLFQVASNNTEVRKKRHTNGKIMLVAHDIWPTCLFDPLLSDSGFSFPYR